MSKVTYTYCDNCQKDLSNTDEFITIGSESGKEFMFNNNIEGSKILMSRYTDIHICSNECFMKFFRINLTKHQDNTH